MAQCKLIEVIETWEKRGKGTNDDIVRNVHQFWSKEGELLMENDPDGKLGDFY